MTDITISRHHPRDSHGRVPYEHLTDDEQDALHRWCQLHQIDHTRVPTDPLIERDGPEWRIRVLHQRNGKTHLDPGGDIAHVILRRAVKAQLPWRMARPDYGDATLAHHADGTVEVLRADRVIGVTLELWDNMRPGHRHPDGTLQLDTAGEYRYRQIGEDWTAAVLIFERIEAR